MLSENSIGKRIRLIINHKNLSIRAFSSQIGCSNTAINNIINEKTDPGFSILFSILTTFKNINAEWLIIGKGEMVKPITEDNSSSSELSPSEELKKIKETNAQLISTNAQLVEMNAKLIEKLTTKL